MIRRIPNLRSLISRIVGLPMWMLLLGFPILATAQPADSRDLDALTLDRALELAVAHNRGLQAQQQRSTVAAAAVDEARAGAKPTVSAGGLFQRTDNPVAVFGNLLSQGEFTEANFAIDSLNNPDPLSHWQGRLDVRWPLWSGGRVRHGVEAARRTASAVDADTDGARQELLRRVAEGYIAAVVAQRRQEVVATALEASERHVALAQDLYVHGLVVESDLLQAQVRRLAVEEEEIRAQSDAQIARAALNRLLGRPLETPFRLPEEALAPSVQTTETMAKLESPPSSDRTAEEVRSRSWGSPVSALEVRSLRDADGGASVQHSARYSPQALPSVSDLHREAPTPTGAPGGELDQLIADALDGRPELAAAEERREAAGGSLRRERAANRPWVEFNAALEVNTGAAEDFFDEVGENWGVGVTLRLPLFDGGRRRARVRQAQANLEAARLEQEDLAAAVGLEVRRAHADLVAATARLRAAAAGVGLAERSLTLVEDRYREGLARITELLDAETALTEARLRREAAMGDRRLAQVHLRRATGRLRIGDAL